MKITPPTIIGASILLITAALAASPFYSVGYLLLILYAAYRLNFSATFSTYFGRVIVASLISIATIMFAGLVAWLANVEVHPFIVLGVQVVVFLLLRKSSSSLPLVKPLFDKGDAVALLLALAAPVIVTVSFFLPTPTYSAAYQFLSNGWDNAAHISMLETSSIENSYVYGKYEDVKERTIVESNAYPQAWHLATAHFTDGFGSKLLNPTNPLQVISTYIFISFFWIIIAIYCFSRVSWSIFLRHASTKQLNFATILLFMAANALVQLVLFGVDLAYGFVNYIGILAYLSLIVGMIIEKRVAFSSSHYVIAVIAGTAASLSWFLPLPAIVATIGLAFIPFEQIVKRKNYTLSKILRYVPVALLTIVASAALLFQIAIFVLYSSDDGGSKLNVPGGTVQTSGLIIIIMLAVSSFYWLTRKKDILSNQFAAIVAPISLLMIGIYLYQQFSVGKTSYYLYKVEGLAVLMIGIFFIPAFTLLLTSAIGKYTSRLSVALIGICLLGVVIASSDQSVLGFSRLLQRNSKVTTQTADALIDYLKNADHKNERIVVLTWRPSDTMPIRSESFNGNLVFKLTHQPITCAEGVGASGPNLSKRLKYLKKCANSTDKKVTLVVNDKVKPYVDRLNLSNNVTVVTVK